MARKKRRVVAHSVLAASNTRDCFREVVGKRVKGVLFDECPSPSSPGTKTLIFEDGTGLTIASSGAYWRESAATIKQAVEVKKKQLARLQQDIEDVLTAAGEKV